MFSKDNLQIVDYILSNDFYVGLHFDETQYEIYGLKEKYIEHIEEELIF